MLVEYPWAIDCVCLSGYLPTDLPVYLSACLSTYLSACISTCLTVYLSVCLPAYLSTHLSLSLYLSAVYIHTFLPVCLLALCLSVCLPTYLPTYMPAAWLSACLPIYISVHTHLFTLLWRFLLTEGDPGCPGLGTPLEAVDPVAEWRCPAFSRTVNTEEGACCWETFCSSAANCLGSTPGERWCSAAKHTHTILFIRKGRSRVYLLLRVLSVSWYAALYFIGAGVITQWQGK